MDSMATSCPQRRRSAARAGLILLGLLAPGATASAADKPPLLPDDVAPFTTDSRISASIEFSLPALAAEIEKNIPRRLATIDERVSCVHRRVLLFRINANCDIYGYVERTGGVSLSGRGDSIYGSLPIYGALEGQGANRFTARIHGETEASATVEAEARPELSQDWSLALNFSNGFHWSEPPVLHVLGRAIPISKYAEPRIRAQLAQIRERVLAAARRLDLRDKAATAWRQAFEPVELAENPETWLQLAPRSVAFAGVSADKSVLRGSLELSGSAVTVVGPRPAAVTASALPSLGRDIIRPGEFDVILPVRIGYGVLKDKIAQLIGAMAPVAGMSVPEVEVYPSSGKLVVGLRIVKASDANANAGRWIYLTGALQVDADGHAVRLTELSATTDDQDLAAVVDPIVSRLRDKASIDYGVAYENLLSATNARLNRPLKDGFRMEGNLASAKLEKWYLPADGIELALRASGNLKILYGM
jgi:Domain of unknown function (DUF4403)